MTLHVTFRDARPGDEHVVARHVRGIADAEGLVHKVSAAADDYAALLFCEHPVLRGVMAEIGISVAGSVLWYPVVSSYTGRLGVRIEDVFVEPDYRGRGLGRRIFSEMARLALAGGYDRLQWSVKDDNRMAVRLYDRLGSKTMDGFTVHALHGAALTALAAP